MIYFIHYNPADGEILGWGFGFEPEPIAGMAVAEVPPFNLPPDPAAQWFDGASVIDKTPAACRRARQPKRFEIEAAIFAELTRTDCYMISDYPIDDETRATWRKYRQALRQLRGDVADMISNWPASPDGIDTITALRERL